MIWFPYEIDGDDNPKGWLFLFEIVFPIEDNKINIKESVEDSEGKVHEVKLTGDFIKENNELFVDGYASHVCKDLNLESNYDWFGLHEDDITIDPAGLRQVPSDIERVVMVDLAD